MDTRQLCILKSRSLPWRYSPFHVFTCAKVRHTWHLVTLLLLLASPAGYVRAQHVLRQGRKRYGRTRNFHGHGHPVKRSPYASHTYFT